MVGVPVGEQQDRHGAPAPPAQAAVDRPGVRARVDHQGLSGAGPQRERIALPHIADPQDPVGGRPCRAGDPHADQRQQRPRQTSRQCPARRPSGQRRHQRHTDDGQQERPGHPSRPPEVRARHGRTGAGDADQPGRRQVSQPGQPLRQRQADRCDQRGSDTGQGRRGDRRDSQQVGRDRERTEAAGDRHDDRTAEDLRGRGDGKGCRQPQRQPSAQGYGPRRREHEQTRGGQDREREARRSRQPRIDEYEHENGSRQRRDGAPAAPGQQRHQTDQPHGRGPQNTG